MHRAATHFGNTWQSQDLTYTRANHDNESLVTSEVEGNNGVILLSAHVLGIQGVDISH